MICIAASTSLAFRSFIFASAISFTWATVTVPTVCLPGVLAPRLQLGGLLQVVRRGRRLDVHGEGLVLIVGDHGRAGRTRLHVLRLGVERLAEFHDVDAALDPEPDQPAGRGLPDRQALAASCCQRVSWPLAFSFVHRADGGLHPPLPPAPSGAPSGAVLRGQVRRSRPPRLPRMNGTCAPVNGPGGPPRAGQPCLVTCVNSSSTGVSRPKDRNRDLEALVVLVDLFDHSRRSPRRGHR